MPSSHSATVAALAAAVGLQEGFGGSVFAVALTLACVVRTLHFVVIGMQVINVNASANNNSNNK